MVRALLNSVAEINETLTHDATETVKLSVEDYRVAMKQEVGNIIRIIKHLI